MDVATVDWDNCAVVWRRGSLSTTSYWSSSWWTASLWRWRGPTFPTTV